VRTILSSRQLGHVFAPVWHAQTGALFGFDATPRFVNGMSWHEAVFAAREMGELGELASLSLLSAVRTGWQLPGRLKVPVGPAQDMDCALPWDRLLRKSREVVIDVDLALDGLEEASTRTLEACRAAGVSIALSARDAQTLRVALTRLRPDIVRMDASRLRGDDGAATLSRVHDAGALLLCDGVGQGSDVTAFAGLGCDLVAGPALGRPAPADAWTPARIGLSWPFGASL
jgi:EAL domain-containing protein (putative c-di-GMP-specific phosphodiesterase class I)